MRRVGRATCVRCEQPLSRCRCDAAPYLGEERQAARGSRQSILHAFFGRPNHGDGGLARAPP
eukprot:4096834-Alexandrium_andersonii.AAC.1